MWRIYSNPGTSVGLNNAEMFINQKSKFEVDSLRKAVIEQTT
jgi:hypothetical protein